MKSITAILMYLGATVSGPSVEYRPVPMVEREANDARYELRLDFEAGNPTSETLEHDLLPTCWPEPVSRDVLTYRCDPVIVVPQSEILEP